MDFATAKTAILAAVHATLPRGADARVSVSNGAGLCAEVDIVRLPSSMPLRSPEYRAHMANDGRPWTYHGDSVSPEVRALLCAIEAAVKAVRPDCAVMAGLDVHLSWSDVPRKRWTGNMYVSA